MTPEYTTLQQPSVPDPLEIERSLSSLWRQYSQMQHEETGGVVRARLANLVSFCRTADEAGAASAAVAALNATRPVRSIVVSADPEAHGAPEAEAALKCSRFHDRPVCFEEVTLRTPGASMRTLPSLLEPLTIPDLPVYLWFPSDPGFDRPEMERLLPLVDRVVTDSHTFRDPLARFGQIHHRMSSLRGNVLFTELTWARLGTWREAVGKLFDPPENRDALRRVDGVTITSTRGAGDLSDRGLLMLGWLASRLGWQALPTAFHGNDLSLLGSKGKVKVEFREGQAQARGHLMVFEIRAGDTAFRVERVHGDPEGAIRSVVVRGGQEEAGPALRPQHWRIHELLCHELEIRTKVADWEDAAAFLANLRGGTP